MKKHTAAEFFKKVSSVRQKDVARFAKMSLQGVNNFARGKRQPSPEQVQRMNAALDKIQNEVSNNRIKE